MFPLADEFDFSEGTLLLDVAIGPHARFTPNINSNEVPQWVMFDIIREM